MKLKFCGLTRKADIEAANETKPDFIGFVFAESRRHVSDMDAARLKEHLDPEIKAVGVFVNDEPEHIAALVRDEVIDIIQLHGGEIEVRSQSGEYCEFEFFIPTAAPDAVNRKRKGTEPSNDER